MDSAATAEDIWLLSYRSRKEFLHNRQSGGMSDWMPGCLLCLWHCLSVLSGLLSWWLSASFASAGGGILRTLLLKPYLERYSGDESCRMEPWRQFSAGVTGREAWSTEGRQWRLR